MHARPIANRQNMVRIAKFAFTMGVVMVVSMIANYWWQNKTLDRLFIIMAMGSNTLMLVGVFGAQAEARYWRWRALRSPWHFTDPKEKLTHDGNHMVVGVRWNTLNPEVAAWCQEQCKGSYGVIPWIGEFDIAKPRTIWFSDGDDAFHFKMRWL